MRTPPPAPAWRPAGTGAHRAAATAAAPAPTRPAPRRTLLDEGALPAEADERRHRDEPDGGDRGDAQPGDDGGDRQTDLDGEQAPPARVPPPVGRVPARRTHAHA